MSLYTTEGYITSIKKRESLIINPNKKSFHLIRAKVARIIGLLSGKIEDDSDKKDKNVTQANTSKILKFVKKVKFSHEIGGYSLATQKARTAHCGHINVNGLLRWLWGGEEDLPEFSVLSKKIGLSPASFVEVFNKYSPEGYSMEIQHLSNEDTIKTVETQIKDGLPVPIIYVPIGGNIQSPHYATIIGIGKKSDGTKIFKIKDSMSHVIPRDYLTETELLKSLAFNNLTSKNTTKDVALKIFAAGARLRLGGENTLFLIHKPIASMTNRKMRA